MVEDIKKINIKEFREFGFLQEINRLFLHPLGLALEVQIDDVTSEESLGGIWDYREDPEGILFSGSLKVDPQKVQNVKEFTAEKHKTRKEALGYVIQKS